MKILYVIDTMRFGGAAKKTTTIANELVRRGHEVHIITDTRHEIGFSLNPAIEIISLYSVDGQQSTRFLKIVGKMWRIRKIVTALQPDVVISVMPHVSLYTKLALIWKKHPVVFSDETSFARADSSLIHFIRHRFYNIADAVVVLTENDVRILGKNIPRKIAIHNPVECSKFDRDFNSKNKTILAIGSLKEWDIKGFDLLIQAFGKIANKYPNWELAIAGDDREPYKTKVLELAKLEGVLEQIKILGYRKDIYEVMSSSSIYALSSRIEGFSLSLVEALAQGCCCVAFENYGVINEVTCGGKGVLLVKDGDIDSYSCALEKLLKDEDLRIKLAKEGHLCVEKYSVQSIVDKWEIVLNGLIYKE